MRRWRTPFELVVTDASLDHAQSNRRRWPLRLLIPGLSLGIRDDAGIRAIVRDLTVLYPTAPTLRGVAVQEGNQVRISGTLWWTQLKMLQGVLALAACVCLWATVESAISAPSYIFLFGACALGFLGFFLWEFFGEVSGRRDDEAELIEKLTEVFSHAPGAEST